MRASHASLPTPQLGYPRSRCTSPLRIRSKRQLMNKTKDCGHTRAGVVWQKQQLSFSSVNFSLLLLTIFLFCLFWSWALAYNGWAIFPPPTTLHFTLQIKVVSESSGMQHDFYFVCMWEHGCIWRSGQFVESVFSFSHVGSGDRTHIIRIGSKNPYLVSNPMSHCIVLKCVQCASLHTPFSSTENTRYLSWQCLRIIHCY